jgi:predicted DNA-binding protein (UPF0251 family)
MNAELEALLKSYDAFLQCPGEDALRLRDLFESRLNEAAAKSNISADVLRQAIRRKYPQWVRANSRPPTLPK